MPVLMDAFDTEGNIVVWNKECERVTGYAAEEIVGNPHAIELLYPDPTQRELMLSGWKKRDKEFRNLECEVTCKDGSAKIIAWSDVSHKYPIPGSEAWSIGVDVTDRRRAEEEKELAHAELDQIFRTAGDSMCVIDKDFNMVRANDEFHALSGSAEKVAGRKCYEILPCSFCHTLECPAVRVLGGEERVECDVDRMVPVSQVV